MATLRRMLDGDRLRLDGIHFLLVDDNAHALQIMAQVVAGFGVRNISKADSAATARQALMRGGVDIVLTDAQMPGETGYQLIEWIRREAPEPTRYVPVVIVTVAMNMKDQPGLLTMPPFCRAVAAARDWKIANTRVK